MSNEEYDLYTLSIDEQIYDVLVAALPLIDVEELA